MKSDLILTCDLSKSLYVYLSSMGYGPVLRNDIFSAPPTKLAAPVIEINNSHDFLDVA